jgi:hypothetical protein
MTHRSFYLWMFTARSQLGARVSPAPSVYQQAAIDPFTLDG